jgi:hypothetical protein
MRLSGMLAAPLIFAAGASVAVAQPQLEKQVKALEKTVEEKTGYYEVRWAKQKLAMKRTEAPKGSAPQDDPAVAYSADIDVPYAGASIVNAWITLQVEYKSAPRPLSLEVTGLTYVKLAAYLPDGAKKCVHTQDLPSGTQKASVLFFCQAVVNRQAAEIFAITAVVHFPAGGSQPVVTASGKAAIQTLKDPFDD